MPAEPAELAAASKAFVIAPAGFGKTELITRAVQASQGRSLVLTHTHSGVNAIRGRFERYGVPKDKYEVATIAGWALRWVSSYPHLAGWEIEQPSGADWAEVYAAGVRLLAKRVTRDLVERSYSGVYVDEYQDCNLTQHAIIMGLSALLPVRLLGDPLQAIFDFAEPTINWESDVVPNFERLDDLTTPYRWLNHNPDLGEWIGGVRESLLRGNEIDLRDAPLTWAQSEAAEQRRLCFQTARHDGTVIAIGRWPNECHDLARSLGGVFTSMEELDCKGLMQFCADLDASTDAFERIVLLIDFAADCFTSTRSALKAPLAHYRQRSLPDARRYSTNQPVVAALNDFIEAPSTERFIAAVRALERVPDARPYRRELWSEMKTTLLTARSRADETLSDVAWYVRDRSRHGGRRPENRLVSRILLVKGLEFDHAVVLDASPGRHGLNAKEAYVAMTRGTATLSVLSGSPTIRYPLPANIV